MKTYLIACFFIAAAFSRVSAQQPNNLQGFHAPVTTSKQERHRPAPPVTQKAVVDGVIPRGIRGGNLLQVLNPRAPRRYGTSQEAVSYDPEDQTKWRGIKLFEIRF